MAGSRSAATRCLFPAIACLLFLAASPARGQYFFGESFFYVPSTPDFPALADLNHDGKLDLIIAIGARYRSEPSSVTVWLNSTGLGFEGPTSYTVGPNPHNVVVGDLNDDGHPDIVDSDFGGSTVSILFGDGTGVFGNSLALDVGAAPVGLMLADVTRDGLTDIVVPNYGSSTVSILPRTGPGTFGTRIDLSSGPGPYWVAAGELNGDGRIDIASANNSNGTISVWFGGEMPGSFSDPIEVPATDPEGAPLFVAIDDFTGDGQPDILSANVNAGTISVMAGNGAGGFGPPVTSSVNASPSAAVVYDVDFDGDLDVVTTNFDWNTGSILLNDGTGSFPIRKDFPAGYTPNGIAAGDLNGDLRPDLAVPNWSPLGVTILTADWFDARNDFTFFPAQPLYCVSLGDVNGDGKIDAATGPGNGTTGAAIWFGNGLGGFTSRTLYPAGGAIHGISLADMNNDTKIDLVMAMAGYAAISIRLGDGMGGFGPNADFATLSGMEGLSIADMNGDNKPDAVSCPQFTNSVTVMFGDGGGGFSSRSDVPLSSFPKGAAVADVNLDGKLDIVVARNGDLVSILFGDGNGGFPTSANYPTDTAPFAVAVGDLNGDAWPDLSTANYYGTATVYLGAGNGIFTGRADFGIGGNSPMAIRIVDITGDGLGDILTTSLFNSVLTILRGHGDGTFEPRTDRETSLEPYGMDLGDLTGDGHPDLVVATHYSQRLSIWLAAPGPWFLSQPLDQAVCAPDSLHLTASTIGPITGYQWQRNGLNLFDGPFVSGVQTPSLTIASAFPSDAGQYRLLLTRTGGTSASQPATVTVCEVPAFSSGPSSVTVSFGGSAIFTAEIAQVCDAPDLQWVKDGVPLLDGVGVSGATTPSLTITDTDETDAGTYYLSGTNNCGTQQTAAAVLMFAACLDPPMIDAQPADQFVVEGSPASFSVGATACAARSYSWLKNNMVIPGAAGNTLSIPSVSPSDAGFYRVAVTAAGLTTLSRIAVLNVEPPIFTSVSQTATTGCTPQVTIAWTTNVDAEYLFSYEYTSSPTFPANPSQSQISGPARSGSFSQVIPASARYLCYRIRATDAADRTSTTSDRIMTLPPQTSFSLANVTATIVPIPGSATLFTTNDAVAVGLQVTNGNCTALNSQVYVDQATLKTAVPRKASGPALPNPIANGIAAGATVRMPLNLLFLKSQVNVPSGGLATFKARIKITGPVSGTINVSGTIRMP